MGEPTVIFARRLRELRTKAGINQTQLAKEVSNHLGANLDPSAITRIEKEDRGVRLDEAVYIAEVLRVPLAALLTDEDEIDTRLSELHRDLASRRDQMQRAESELTQAMLAVAYVEREIEQLQATVRAS